MADETILDLPAAASLSGSENVWVVQGGVDRRTTITAINQENPANLPAGGAIGQGLIKSGISNYQAEWKTLTGTGTIQEIDTGTGLTGGPITLTGTISFASISTGNVLANVSGISAAPTPTAPSAVLDVIGSTRGDILYRGAAGWSALPPGTLGFTLTSQGAGADPTWSSVGTGTVTSVALAVPNIFTVSGSPVTTTGTLTATLNNQNANLVWAGPSTGAAETPTFRALVGADLPNPSAATLGGIQSALPVTHQWINSISTSGAPALSQPSFADISGTITLSQFGSETANTILAGPTSGGAVSPTFRTIVGADLPNPSSSSLGGVQSLASVSHKWINTISTSGVPSATQPDFSDITGVISSSQLPTIGNNTVLANVSGTTNQPSGTTPSVVLDILSSTQGTLLYRNASVWVPINPGTTGQVLTTNGAAANPSWETVTGTGTVTSVATGTGLTGGPITTTGTVSFANIANNKVLANVSGISAAPTATDPTSILDIIGSAEGDILYRGASTWAPLAPGTSGQFLQTLGAAATPTWSAAVTSVATAGILTGGPVTSTGTLNVNATIVPQGRLTLATGTPVMMTTVAGATTVYYAQYSGNLFSLYDGTNMVPTAFTELSQATTDATKSPAAVAANKNYDIFVWSDSGTMRATRGPAWSSDTARGTGAGTTELQRVNGLWTNKVAVTNGPGANRGTYVGTIRSNGSSTIDYIFGAAAAGGTAAFFGVWNCYNRVYITTMVQDSTTSWTSTASGYEPSDAAGTGSGLNNRVSMVCGMNEDGVFAAFTEFCDNTASSAGVVAIGLDSTTVAATSDIEIGAASASAGGVVNYSGAVGIGFHYLQLLQRTTGSHAAVTFWGKGVGHSFVATLRG